MSKELAKLTRKADAVAISASRLLSDQIKIIQGEIASWGKRLNIAGSAKDREVVYELIRKRMKQLSRKLDTLMAAQNELAGKTAAKVASDMTGLDIKYSAKRAEAITELVTPTQGENLAAVFTERMSNHLINTLRQATVEALREQAIAGGTLKELSKELAWKWMEKAKEPPVFVDAGGKAWNTQTYFQMQSRTNSMRIYNDCLIDDVARETGSDIMRISRGGDPNCHCFAWEGCIISISGKTKGLPTYEQARKGGCFHPNCTHTLEYVDEAVDSDEIELAKSHPVVQGKEDDADAQYDRRREIDIARKMRENGSISRSEAEVLVDRDNLADAIRTGLVRSDARQIVDALTDAQVRALITNGRTPRFEPTKKATKEDPHAADEKWIHGKRGGVVHISRTATVEDIIEVTKIEDKTGIISAIAVTTKKVVKNILPVKKASTKTLGEIMSMNIADAIKETEYLVADIEKANVPENVTRQEARFERIKQVLDTRMSAVYAELEKLNDLSKAYKKASGEEAQSIKAAYTTTRKKYEAAWNKYAHTRDLYYKVSDKLHDASLPWVENLLHHGKDKCVIKIKTTSKQLPKWNEAQRLIEKIVSRDVFPDKSLTIRKIQDYHRASESMLTIRVNAQEGYSTHVHEAMHFIEDNNAHVHDRCVEFLQYRTQGEKKKPLKDLIRNKHYDKDEYARADHFFSPYCGKAYEWTDFNGNLHVSATEILSMGVERLVINPVRFLQEDREYATMCLNLIRGNL